MKYKTLFRLALKWLGVWLVISSTGRLAEAVMQILALPDSIEYVLIGAPSLLFTFVVGLYLFFGGAWIANLAIPSNRRYCPECAYELRGLRGLNCPECGTQIIGRSLTESEEQ
ncbi:MAG: hypothetical protein IT430_11720 [Phycisphaerales bacterium]|nr:hypothetical protein [Phycisphaerales bacterium]